MKVWDNSYITMLLGTITTYDSVYPKTPIVYRADPTDGRAVRCFATEQEARDYLAA